MGPINVHHFAHKSRIECDEWYGNKGSWHRYMQSQFKDKVQEVPVKYDGRTHIADVLFSRKHLKPLVIEFQESPISSDDFLERTRFYQNAGDEIMWVFNFQNRENIYQTNSVGDFWSFGWCWNVRFFRDFDPKRNLLFFVLDPDLCGEKHFCHIKYQYRNYRYFGGNMMSESGWKNFLKDLFYSKRNRGGVA